MTPVAITPTLYIGEDDANEFLSVYIPCTTAADAWYAIEHGGRALLPPGSWREARWTLEMLDCPSDWIEEVIQRAGGE